MGRIQDKVAVITGENSGIGLATAKLFGANGARVFMTGRRKKELDAAVSEVGGSARGIQCDISELPDLDRLFAIVRDGAGMIGVLFANAGGGDFLPLGSITEEHFDKIFSTNVKGTLFTVQKALPLMRDGGSIILTGSTAATKGTPAFSVYSASKAAIRTSRVAGFSILQHERSASTCLSPVQPPHLAGMTLRRRKRSTRT